MAKYTITHICGHTSTQDLTGPSRDRQWRIGKYEGEDCWPCQRAKRDAANAAATAQAVAVAEASGLPSLEGTPKQIAWAETIRANFITNVAPAIRVLTEEYVDPAHKFGSYSPWGRHLNKEQALLITSIVEGRIIATSAMTDAHDWIEARSLGAETWLREYLKTDVPESDLVALNTEAQWGEIMTAAESRLETEKRQLSERLTAYKNAVETQTKWLDDCRRTVCGDNDVDGQQLVARAQHQLDVATDLVEKYEAKLASVRIVEKSAGRYEVEAL